MQIRSFHSAFTLCFVTYITRRVFYLEEDVFRMRQANINPNKNAAAAAAAIAPHGGHMLCERAVSLFATSLSTRSMQLCCNLLLLSARERLPLKCN
jgi:hypothetical protein